MIRWRSAALPAEEFRALPDVERSKRFNNAVHKIRQAAEGWDQFLAGKGLAGTKHSS
jgi:hypothetical protein